jgi:hypothetical protein
MKATYVTNLISSFYLWLDHEILDRGEAFINYSGKLYNSPDPNFPLNSVYSAPFRQWVYDSSIQNANIPSGIFINGGHVARGVNGLNIDFNKGRAILNSGIFIIQTNVKRSYYLKKLIILPRKSRKLLGRSGI